MSEFYKNEAGELVWSKTGTTLQQDFTELRESMLDVFCVKREHVRHGKTVMKEFSLRQLLAMAENPEIPKTGRQERKRLDKISKDERIAFYAEQFEESGESDDFEMIYV